MYECVNEYFESFKGHLDVASSPYLTAPMPFVPPAAPLMSSLCLGI